jgi:hypothetical protein
LGAYFYLVIGLSFAFEIWYFAFGFFLLFDYFKKNHFKEFYITQWGLICPLVAFVVLGGFVYSVVLASPILYAMLVITMLLAIFFYFELLFKYIKCSKKSAELNCEF